MKQQEQAPKVGDFIITTDEFKIKNGKGSLIVMDDFYGIIVQRVKDQGKVKFGVKFGEGMEWTNDLNGLLSSPCGYYLSLGDFYLDN